MSAPAVSIIIAVHNRLDLTRLCLATLASTLRDLPHEVIIVDDLSTDGTRDYLRNLPPPHRIFLNEQRGNFSINNNRAAHAARADVLCFLNNDTELTRGWLPPMLAALQARSDAGLIGNQQKLPRNGRFDHAGVVFAPWLTPTHFGQGWRRLPAALHTGITPWSAVTAACVVTHRDTFFAAGGFEEAYVNGAEDMDLCLKMHRQGRRHYVANESIIWHHKGASPGRKKFNDTNLARFKKIWGDYLRANFTERDAPLFAQTYLHKALRQPWNANGHKTLACLLIRAGLRQWAAQVAPRD